MQVPYTLWNRSAAYGEATLVRHRAVEFVIGRCARWVCKAIHDLVSARRVPCISSALTSPTLDLAFARRPSAVPRILSTRAIDGRYI